MTQSPDVSPPRTFHRSSTTRFLAIAIAIACLGSTGRTAVTQSQAIASLTRDTSGGVLLLDRESDRAEEAAMLQIAVYCGGRPFRILSRHYVAFGIRPGQASGAQQPAIRFRMAYACAGR